MSLVKQIHSTNSRRIGHMKKNNSFVFLFIFFLFTGTSIFVGYSSNLCERTSLVLFKPCQGNKSDHSFSKEILPKVNLITQLEFDPVFYDVKPSTLAATMLGLSPLIAIQQQQKYIDSNT